MRQRLVKRWGRERVMEAVVWLKEGEEGTGQTFLKGYAVKGTL